MLAEDNAMHRMREQGIHRTQGVSWRWVADELHGNAEPGPEAQVIFADTVNRLPPKARKLALFLIEYPDEFRAYVGVTTRWAGCQHIKCCKCRLLKQYLSERLGWSNQTVARALREIRKKLTV